MAEEKKKGNKIDISAYDFEKGEENITQKPGTIAFPHMAGSAPIKPEDKGKLKGRAVAAMHQQTEQQMSQLYEQMQLLAKQANQIKSRVQISERIYAAEMNFEPLINHSYHLYRKQDHDVLSLIAPSEWGRTCPFDHWVATIKLLADHTWEILDRNDDSLL